MRRSVMGVIVCTFILAVVVHAENAPKRVLAEELLRVMKVQKGIEDSFEMIKQMIPAQMKQMGVGDDASTAQAEAAMGKTMDLVMKELSWDKLKSDYITIYAETFTEEELKGAIKFYKSPIGKKFIEKQPELMRRSMEISQKQMATLMPKIKQLTEDSMKK